MRTDRLFWLKTFSLTATLLAAVSLKAATIEVEKEDEEIDAAPTATAVPSNSAPSKPASATQAASAPATAKSAPVTQTAPVPAANPNPAAPLATRRVRVSDNVGFYYFVKAGFVADPDKLPAIGHVVGSADTNISYSMAKRTFIEMDSDKNKPAVGDLLVIYRTDQPVEESHAGSLGYEVENLAIVRVVETQDHRDLVEVVKSFSPFVAGDKVEDYDNEIQRWKEAQIKKPLPAQPTTCYVAGGKEESLQKAFNQLDYIYLTAGTKQGVVEGQTFRLYKVTETGVMEEALRMPAGEVQVIFAGPDASTARILNNSEPIAKGFTAEYKP